jgi:iron complex outermembrane recepter protein
MPPFLLSPLTRHLLLAMATMGMAATATSVRAQTPPPKAADSGELQSVTVTANRRVEDQQKVSVSVTAITGESLVERNITDLSAMESVSAGFTFGRSGADARPAIRGVRTENVATNADTTIGYFVDGIYKSRAGQAMLGFTDVGRVEVMRGPQGTLFGRNTFGGTVAVTTNLPELKTTETQASLLAGSFGKFRFDGAFNMPLGDTAALRLAAAIDRADPYVKNDFNPAAGQFDQDLKYFRASMRFKPSAALDVVVRADMTDQGGKGGSAFGYKQAGTYLDRASCQQLFNATLTVMNVRPGNRDGVNDCTRTVGAGAGTGANAVGASVDLGIPLYAAGNGYRVDNDYETFLKLRDRNFSADVSYRMAGVTLKSITGYADFVYERTSDSDFSASSIGLDYQKTGAKTFTQEFQILSEGTGPLQYVAGVYFFRDKLVSTFINQQLPRTIRSGAIATTLSLPVAGAGFAGFDRPKTDSDAIYGQLSYKLTPSVTFTGGLRYTEDKKIWSSAGAESVLPKNASGAPDTFQITLNTPTPADSAFGTAGATSNCTGSNNLPGVVCEPGTNVRWGYTYQPSYFRKATGKAALDWQVNQDQLLYATVSTGFRSGGFNGFQLIETLRTFQPEEVTAYEVGSKNRFLANRLQLNLAAFRNDYTNLQEQRQVPVGQTTISTIFNAAKARSQGLEAEVQWRATKATSLGGTLSLLDAKYTSFPDVALPFGTSILVADPTTAAAPQTINGVQVAPAGQRRVFAPGYNCSLVAGTGGAGQPAAAYGCDLSGKRIPYAPRYQGSFFAKTDLETGFGTFTPMMVVSFSSGYFGQPTNAEIEKQGSYVKTDLKLNWRVNDTLQVQAFVDNATDKQTINRFVWGGGGALQVSAAPPRTFGLRLSYSTF